LALLDSTDIPHPAIEAVFTVDEEVGMDGACALDASVLHGKRMINIDNEIEGQFITGCAGGARVSLSIPLDCENSDDWNVCCITVSGGLGGHSGVEIDKGRANANMLAGRILYTLMHTEGLTVRFISLDGGEADNAIPGKAVLVVGTKDKIQDIVNVTNVTMTNITMEYASTEPELSASVESMGITKRVSSLESSRTVSDIIISLPNGIQKMSADVSGLVETSLNLGIAKTSESGLLLQFAVRSSMESAKYALIDRISATAEIAGADISVAGVYPGWKYRVVSPLRDKMKKVYETMYGSEPTIEAIHAGLECGFFSEKIDGLDCVSIGPDILDIHTPRERLDVTSVARVWDFLCTVLSQKTT